MKLGIDHWQDHDTWHESLETTDIKDVEAFLRRLDQDRHTIVSLGEADAPCLMVSGGKGNYLVTATLDGENWSTLAMGPRDGPRKPLNGGGQEGDYASEVVVTFDQALAAARTFFLHGALDERMTWITYQG